MDSSQPATRPELSCLLGVVACAAQPSFQRTFASGASLACKPPLNSSVRHHHAFMTKFIIYLLDFIALLASMLMGILGAAGLCALIWGSSILDTALGDSPQRTHPAFITFMVVMIPGMLIGACGAVSGIILPLHLRFRVPLSKSDGVGSRFLRAYATRLIEFTKGDD